MSGIIPLPIASRWHDWTHRWVVFVSSTRNEWRRPYRGFATRRSAEREANVMAVLAAQEGRRFLRYDVERVA